MFIWCCCTYGVPNLPVLEICAVLGYYAASSGNSLPTFRDDLWVPILDPWRLYAIGCLETSVRIYHYSLRNGPEERSDHLLRGGSLKSRTYLFLYGDVGGEVWHPVLFVKSLQWYKSIAVSATLLLYILHGLLHVSALAIDHLQVISHTRNALSAQEMYGQVWRSKAQTFHIKRWMWLCKWIWNFW